jgi:hypothetical protein
LRDCINARIHRKLTILAPTWPVIPVAEDMETGGLQVGEKYRQKLVRAFNKNKFLPSENPAIFYMIYKRKNI